MATEMDERQLCFCVIGGPVELQKYFDNFDGNKYDNLYSNGILNCKAGMMGGGFKKMGLCLKRSKLKYIYGI